MRRENDRRRFKNRRKRIEEYKDSSTKEKNEEHIEWEMKHVQKKEKRYENN